MTWNKGLKGEAYRKHYKNGFGMEGKTLPEETRKKLSKANLGHKTSKETRIKLSLAVLKRKKRDGYINSPETRKKISQALKGREYKEEWKQKLSESHKGKKLSEEHKNKISLKCRGKKVSLETKLKISKSLRGKPSHMKGKRWSLESRKKLSNTLKGRPISVETRRKIGIANKNKIRTKKERERQGRITKKRWKDKNYREKTIKSILKGLMKRPTSLEKQMIDIIKKHNLPYKYTGDGSFLIGYKNPDFINTNGKKICVEVANTFHHDKNYEKIRTEHFKKYGWDCLVFRTDKLNEEEIIKLVKG